jgi:COMPASS component SWD3
VRFSPNGKYVLAWTLDSALRLWNYVDGRCVKTYQGHANAKFSIAGAFGVYGPRDLPAAFVVSGSEDGALWMWDVGRKTVLQTIKGAHEGVVFGADTHPLERCVVSGGADKVIRLWRAEEPEAVGAEPSPAGEASVDAGEPMDG